MCMRSNGQHVQCTSPSVADTAAKKIVFLGYRMRPGQASRRQASPHATTQEQRPATHTPSLNDHCPPLESGHAPAPPPPNLPTAPRTLPLSVSAPRTANATSHAMLSAALIACPISTAHTASSPPGPCTGSVPPAATAAAARPPPGHLRASVLLLLLLLLQWRGRRAVGAHGRCRLLLLLLLLPERLHLAKPLSRCSCRRRLLGTQRTSAGQR